MVAVEGLKIRVQRLLRQEFRPNDLNDLFLYIRDKADGRQSIKEIGDFIAHQTQKEKGIVTQSCREMFNLFVFKMSQIQSGNKIDFNKLPSDFFSILRSSFKLIESQPLKKASGLKRQVAERILSKIEDNFDLRTDGFFAAKNGMSRDTYNLIMALVNTITVKPAFKDDELFRDFSEALKSNGLIAQEDIKKLKDLQVFITLFAISKMHNCTVIIDSKKDFKAHLSVLYESSGNLDIVATAPIQGKNGELFLMLPLFTTTIDPKVHLSEVLLTEARPWTFDIETISADKLDRVR